MDELRRKLIQLETLYGSQKKAAKKLGISERTFRSYKAGTSAPPKGRTSKVNRLLGNKANKEKLQTTLAPKVEKKIRTYNEKQNKPKIEATNRWLNDQFGKDQREHFIVHNLNNETPYVAYLPEHKDAVQFFDGVSTPGKPKGVTYMTVIGIFTQTYYIDDPAAGNLKRIKIPLLNGLTETWDLSKTLSYAEQTFFQQPLQKIGNRKFQPVKFIGFKI